MKRITALDMLRGYALVAIMLDHMPAGVLRNATLSNFAVFDAAELFVLLSGFLVGLVWLTIERRDGRRTAQWRFLRRAIQVWFALISGGVMLALLSGALFAAGMPHTAVWSEYAHWIIENPFGYIGTLVTLWMQPNLLDVLALYVVVLAFTPITVPLMLRWPLAFAAGAIALWAVSIPLNTAIPNQRYQGGMLFNPFAWQLLFHTGIALGLFRERLMPALRRHVIILNILSILFTVFGLVMAQFWRYGPELKSVYSYFSSIVGPVDKWSLDWVRYVGILAAAWLVAVPLARPMAWLADTVIGRALAVIGRGGLISFIACVMLSIIGDALMTLPHRDTSVSFRLSVDLWTVGVLWLVAMIAVGNSVKRKSKGV